jgi:hypothetical protein
VDMYYWGLQIDFAYAMCVCMCLFVCMCVQGKNMQQRFDLPSVLEPDSSLLVRVVLSIFTLPPQILDLQFPLSS